MCLAKDLAWLVRIFCLYFGLFFAQTTQLHRSSDSGKLNAHLGQEQLQS